MYRTTRPILAWLGLALAGTMSGGCERDTSSTPMLEAALPIADEGGDVVRYYDWSNMLPDSVIEAFHDEFGITIDYRTYENTEEAVESLRAGERQDVVNMQSEYVRELVEEGLLLPIEPAHVPNFNNVSVNFRDLRSDPGNRHTVPNTWGTTGLLVRDDVDGEPITRWSDLWSERLAGGVLAWSAQRVLTGIALKSLGHSANSENPDEIRAAGARMQALVAQADILDYDYLLAQGALLSGDYVAMYAWSGDAVRVTAADEHVRYVLPDDGALVYFDNYVISATTGDRRAAERLIDFLHRPEIAAARMQHTHFASTNEAARSMIDPALRDDPALAPSSATVGEAEILLPLSRAARALYDEIWDALQVRVAAAGER